MKPQSHNPRKRQELRIWALPRESHSGHARCGQQKACDTERFPGNC
jgi:hypothetical protein